MNPSDTGRNQAKPQSKTSDSLDRNSPGQARNLDQGMSQNIRQGSQQSGLGQGSRQDSLNQQSDWELEQGILSPSLGRDGSQQSNQSGLGQQSVNQGAVGQPGPLGRDDLGSEQSAGQRSGRARDQGLQRDQPGQQKSSGSGNLQSGSAKPGTVKPSDLSAAEWRESNNQHRYGDGEQGGFESVDLDQVSDIVNRRRD
jgi:hypothetical protein